MKFFTKTIVTCFLFISISCEYRQDKDYSLDFSGMEHFLKIADILENDEEPAAEQWSGLFETPGYGVLTDGEFTREFFKERFRVVFMPSKAQELEEALKKEKEQPFHMQHVHHYVQAKEKKEALKQHMDEFKAHSPVILEKAAVKAKSFLPPIKDENYIPVSFVIFANDARGYTPVVIDMLFAIELGELLPVLIGHELHHYYRNKILAYNPKDVYEEDKHLIWVMDQIHSEGIADQIDKRKLISCEEGPLHFFAGQWESMVQNAPAFIEKMDQLLCSISEARQDKEELSLQLRRALPMSGHPVGFYMANVIIEKSGKEKLVKEAGNPFAFFRLYNLVASEKADCAIRFSDNAMEVIAGLEKKYVKNN